MQKNKTYSLSMKGIMSKFAERIISHLTLQERILLCITYDIDWNYNVKATKTYDIRTVIQREQDKTR